MRTKGCTLHQALDHFILDRQAQNLSEQTTRNYRNGILALVGSQDRQLIAVTPTYLRQRLTRLSLSPTSKQTYLKYLRVFFAFLKAEGLVESDPTATIKPPKATQKVLDALSLQEVKRILRSDLDDRERALFTVLLDTGLRIEECASLRKGQFDRSGGAVILGKGRKERYVKVSSQTLKAVRKLERGIEGVALWEGREGKLSARSLRLILANIGDRVGVKINPHKIRRTTTITMLRNGCNVYSLAAVLGHADINTLKRYLPLAQTDNKEAYEKFGVLTRN